VALRPRKGGIAISTHDDRIVLDPTDERIPIRRTPVVRPPRLHGVVGLLDIRKPRGDVFLNRIEQRLRERAGVEVRRYVKPTFTRPAPIDLRRAIATTCDFVIEALAD
jgi:hypothetical protein